jgi:hypothetical protein
VTRRVIRKSSRYCDLEASDLLQSLFAVELVAPSSILWLISGWISDVPVLDNSAEGFMGVDPGWGPRQIRLSEVLITLATRRSQIVVVTNEDDSNWPFLERLRSGASSQGALKSLHVRQLGDLHEKGLLSDDYHLHGSMNFTHNGLRILAEQLILETESDHVYRTRIDYQQLYGPAT